MKYFNGQLIEETAEDLAQIETDKANAFINAQAEETAKAQKQADALAGNNKLLELGLTQEEATALTGYKPEE